MTDAIVVGILSGSHTNNPLAQHIHRCAACWHAFNCNDICWFYVTGSVAIKTDTDITSTVYQRIFWGKHNFLTLERVYQALHFRNTEFCDRWPDLHNDYMRTLVNH